MPNFGISEEKMPDCGILDDKNAQFSGFEGENGTKMPNFGIL